MAEQSECNIFVHEGNQGALVVICIFWILLHGFGKHEAVQSSNGDPFGTVKFTGLMVNIAFKQLQVQ